MHDENLPKGSSTVRVKKKDSMNWTAYTKFVDERITIRFLFSALAAALGPGFQHGYNLAVLNAPQDVLIEWIKEQRKKQHEKFKQIVLAEDLNFEADFLYSIIVSIYSIGGIFGGLFIYVCYRNRNIGFKKSIQGSNIIAFLASFLMGFSRYEESLQMMMAGRFLMGVNNAFCAGMVITYLAEISPTGLRGTICGIYPLVKAVSTMISQFISVDVALGTKEKWPYLFYLLMAIAIVQFFLVSICVDSPIFLYEIGKISEAKEATRKLYGDDQTEFKFTEIAMKAHYQIRRGDPYFWELFARAEYQSPLMVSCMIMFAQQITGINVISHYTSYALRTINLEDKSEQFILIMGVINVCVTIVTVAIVDIVGRRRLLIFSFATMSIDMLIIYICFYLSQHYNQGHQTIPYIAVTCMIIYVAFFASGAGSIPLFLYAEFFLDGIRPMAASIAIPVNWLTHSFVGMPFLSLRNKITPAIFIIYGVMDFFLLIYIILNVPETKKKNIAEIVRGFVPKSPALSKANEDSRPESEQGESSTPSRYSP